jgi:hypothetical protein
MVSERKKFNSTNKGIQMQPGADTVDLGSTVRFFLKPLLFIAGLIAVVALFSLI